VHLSHPIESVIPSGHGPVLEVLASTEAALTGRQVAGLVEGRLSARRVADVLRELVGSGLVSLASAGSANQYRLNRDHLAAPAVMALADLRGALVEAMADEVRSWAVPAVAVWLYGSVARGEAGPASDVDLCVVRRDSVDEADPVWAGQVAGLQARVLTWTGNHAEVLEYPMSDLRELASVADPIVASLKAEGRAVFGPGPGQLPRDVEAGPS
jgi:hypothetical protein